LDGFAYGKDESLVCAGEEAIRLQDALTSECDVSESALAGHHFKLNRLKPPIVFLYPLEGGVESHAWPAHHWHDLACLVVLLVTESLRSTRNDELGVAAFGLEGIEQAL